MRLFLFVGHRNLSCQMSRADLGAMLWRLWLAADVMLAVATSMRRCEILRRVIVVILIDVMSAA